jgi:hypothetical protein
MLIIGFLETIVYLTSGFIVPKVKRRIGIMIPTIIIGAIGMTFYFNFMKENRTLQVFVVPFSRFLLSISVSFFSIFMI